MIQALCVFCLIVLYAFGSSVFISVEMGKEQKIQAKLDERQALLALRTEGGDATGVAEIQSARRKFMHQPQRKK